MESIESKKTGTALVRSRRRRWKTLAALVLAAFAFCILLMGRRKTFFGDGNVDIIISRTKLAGPDPGYQHISRSVVVSLETERFAYFTIRQGEMRVVIDDVGSPGYSMVYGLRFSNDGERVAYFGLLESDGKAYAFIDGRKEGPYEEVFRPGVIFSPDSAHYVYVASLGGESFLVVDGVVKRKLAAGTRIDDLAMSSDADIIAHTVIRSGHLVAVNGVEGKPYRHVQGLVVSPDGERTAYCALPGDMNGAYVVVNEVEGKEYRKVYNPLFTADSKRIGYRAKLGEAWYAVIDAKEHGPFNEIASFHLTVDGNHFVYMTWDDGGGLTTYVDGKPTQAHSQVCVPQYMADNFLSPDGRHYASEDTLLPLERNWFGRMALRFERLTGIDFIDKSAEVERLLIDGEGGPIFDRSGLVLWSADSRHVAHLVEDRGFKGFAVDGILRREAELDYEVVRWVASGPGYMKLICANPKTDGFFLVTVRLEPRE